MVFFDARKKREKNVDNQLALKQKKGGQPANSLAYIYIHTHICCEVVIWAKFGHLKGYYLGQVRVIIWAKFVLALI